MDLINITPKQQKIHKKNWDKVMRQIIKELWDKEFPEGINQPALYSFIRQADRMALIHAQFMDNQALYPCSCGACPTGTGE